MSSAHPATRSSGRSSVRSSVRSSGRVLAGLLVLLASVGCASAGGDKGPKAGTLRVLAGSELTDLRPILDQAEKDTGVRVEPTYTGTLDGVQQVIDGKADGRFEAVWFSSNRYLSLHPEAGRRLGPATKTMSSPVVLGLRVSVAKRLGWDARQPTWAEIADAAAQERFTYGMTSPAASNSGFSALVGVTAALSGGGAALDRAGIVKVAPQLRRFFTGQTLAAGSSGWLSEAYVRRAADGRPVDGLINYESELLSLAAARLPEPLTIIRPRDGVVSADYPLTQLTSAPGHAKDAYRKITEYLRRPAVQREIMRRTGRRPIVPGVEPDARFPALPPELPFPARLDAVDTLIDAYFNELRRPARTLYVLDVSGSMSGRRIAGLRAALSALTGADGTLPGRFERFHNREEVTLIPFSGRPRSPRSYTIPEKAPELELAKIRSYARSLSPAGGTAVYDGLLRAYEVADAQAARDPDRFTSIVLMSDGESNVGLDLAEFRSRHARLPERVRTVPVFPVLFGEAAADQMSRLAELTGGRTFDARRQSLATVFREIRGYQ